MIWLLVVVRIPIVIACLGLLAVALQLFWAGLLQLHAVTSGMALAPFTEAGKLMSSASHVIDVFMIGLALVLVASLVLVAFVARPIARGAMQATQPIDDVSHFRKAFFELLVIFATVILFRSVLASNGRFDVSLLAMPALIFFVAALQFTMRLANPIEAPRNGLTAAPAKPAVAVPAKPAAAAVAAPAKPAVAAAAPAKPAVAAAVPAKPAVAAPAKPAAPAVAAKPAAAPAAVVAKPAAVVPAKPAIPVGARPALT